MKKRIISLVLAIAVALSLASIPTSASGGMQKQRETDHFEFYCTEADISALDDLAESFEGCYERVTSDLGKAPSGKTSVNIYPNLQTFHAAVGRPNSQDWLVGMAKNGRIYMVSPLNPGSEHDYNSIITVAVHEFVHTVVEQFKRQQPTYLNEGIASYEAGQGENVASYVRDQMSKNKVPSLSLLEKYDTNSEGLYQYGYAYIDFIVKSYGFDKVIELLEGKSRTEALGKSEQELNKEWWAFLASEYQDTSAPEGLNLEKATEHFILHFTQQDEAVANKLAEKFEEDYSKIAVDLKKSLTSQTIVDIYPDLDSFHDAIGQPNAGDQAVVASTIDYRHIMAVSPENPGSYHDYAMKQLIDGSSQLYEGLCTLLDSSSELAAGIDRLAAGTTQLKQGAGDLSAGAAQLQSGAASLSQGLSALAGNNESLNGGAAQVFQNLLDSASSQLKAAGIEVPELTAENYGQVLDGVIASAGDSPAGQQVAALKASLESYNGFYQGLRNYTAGVAQSAAGAGELDQGIASLKTGADSLSAGADQLYDGILTMKDSTPALIDGVTQLRDGAMELNDGLKEFNEQGVQKLVDAFDGDLSSLIDRVDTLREVSERYNSFSGISEDMDGQVKFVWRTDAVETQD